MIQQLSLIGISAQHIFDENFEELKLQSVGTLKKLFLLMRETIEPNESIEQCLSRGLMEEFGMVATLKSYLGSIVSVFPIIKDGVATDIKTQKTTLYFLCDLVSIDASIRNSYAEKDVEARSEMKWMDPNELILKMKEQGKRLNREDADESVVIERLLKME